MKWKNSCRVLTGALCCFLALQPVYGEQGDGHTGLKIVVLEGANAKNVTQEIPLTALSVRLEAGNNQPVANATVVFTSPESGPSGEFANDSRSFSVITNEDGVATARGYHPNSITGSYSIRARATWQGQIAATDIPQRNVAPGEGRLGKRIVIIAIAGAAAGAIIAATRGGNSSGTTSNAPTITLGGSAVGAPRYKIPRH